MADRTPPTPIAMIIGTAIISVITGYMLGIASSLGILPNPFADPSELKAKTNRYDDEEESAEEEIDDNDVRLDHAPNWANGVEADKRQGLRASALPSAVKAAGSEEKKAETKDEVALTKKDWENSTEECKLVLVVRTDLGMTKGKIAAQCGHATLACYKSLLRNDPKSPILRRWERLGQAKVALQVKSEDEMLELMGKALSLGITAEIIADAGRTQIASGSHTVLGIGPAPKSVVDVVTGHLKLL